MEFLSPAPVHFPTFGVPPPGLQFSPFLFATASQQQPQQEQARAESVHSAEGNGETEKPKKKRVTFREYVTVAFTYPSDEYDRTSTKVEPLTKNDLIELLLYRAEMQQYTRELMKLRKQALEAERRYKQQQEIAAFQAYQRCSMAAATSAAAAQRSQQSAYPWDHAAAIAAAAAASAAGPAYAPQQPYYAPSHERGFPIQHRNPYGVMYY